MRRGAVTAILVFACAAGPSSQDAISIEFHDGHVRLIAESVSIGRILEEWTRVGGTTFVGGDGLAGPPVTVQLSDVPESEALDVVLRGVAGFVATARATPAPGRSHFDKVLMLPVTSPAPSRQPASASGLRLRETEAPPPESDPSGAVAGAQLGLREAEVPPATRPASPADGPQKELRGVDPKARGGSSKPPADAPPRPVREVEAPPSDTDPPAEAPQRLRETDAPPPTGN